MTGFRERAPPAGFAPAFSGFKVRRISISATGVNAAHSGKEAAGTEAQSG